MSRAIKFRAWDKVSKQILLEDDLFFNEFVSVTDMFEDDDFSFLQYTGLKDKNGTEIYEGDIVSICHEDYQDEESEKSIGKVAYNLLGEYPAFDIYVKTGRGVSGLESYSDEYNSFTNPEHVIEVIGNIYENPELLGE